MKKQTIATGAILAGCTLLLIAGCSTNGPTGDQGKTKANSSKPSMVVEKAEKKEANRVPKKSTASNNGKLSSRFPNIQLYAQDNQPVRFYDDLVKDKIVLVNFMYTSCVGT